MSERYKSVDRARTMLFQAKVLSTRGTVEVAAPLTAGEGPAAATETAPTATAIASLLNILEECKERQSYSS